MTSTIVNILTPADQMFLRHVEHELLAARDKFPTNQHRHAAFAEEAGELSRALLEVHYGKEPHSAVWKEAKQAAAMACRVAVEGDPTFSYDPREALVEVDVGILRTARASPVTMHAVVEVLKMYALGATGGPAREVLRMMAIEIES